MKAGPDHAENEAPPPTDRSGEALRASWRIRDRSAPGKRVELPPEGLVAAEVRGVARHSLHLRLRQVGVEVVDGDVARGVVGPVRARVQAVELEGLVHQLPADHRVYVRA